MLKQVSTPVCALSAPPQARLLELCSVALLRPENLERIILICINGENQRELNSGGLRIFTKQYKMIIAASLLLIISSHDHLQLQLTLRSYVGI